MIEYLIWFIGCIAVGTLGVYLARGYAICNHWMDEPNERSFHDSPTPRIGGIGLLAPLFLCLVLVSFLPGRGLALAWWAALVPAFGVALLSFFDDRFNLPRILRFAAHVLCANIVLLVLREGWIGQTFPLIGISLPVWLAGFLLVVWMAGLTNSYNFMDGIDGIAALQAIIGLCGWLLVLMTADIEGGWAGAQAIVLIALIGGSVGFLFYNWPPASIFLGDIGSTFLGFYMAALPIAFAACGMPLSNALEAGVLFVWPFIIDAGTTFTRRLIRRESVFNAHRSHLYQIFAGTFASRDSGHRLTSLLFGALSLLGVGLYFTSGPLWAKLAVLAGVWIAVAAWTYGIRQKNGAAPQSCQSVPGNSFRKAVPVFDPMAFDIFLSPPEITGAEYRRVAEAFDSGYIAPVGPQVNEFEQQLAKYLGFDEVHALSSGTAAIHLGLRAIGVGPDDCVLCPDLTFVASCNPIRYLGAEPVLVDVDPENWAIDPRLVEEAISELKKEGKPIKAMVVVHTLGLPAPMRELMSIAEREGIKVLEDCAGAFGSQVDGLSVGSFGDAAAFSFNGNKILTTSGGGALYIRDKTMRSAARSWSDQGKRPGIVGYEHDTLGYNYKLSNICAAIGLGQMETLGERLERKTKVLDTYRELLSDIPDITFMPQPAYGRSNHWLTTISLGSDAVAEELVTALRKERIEASPMWKPMHLQCLNKDLRCFGGEASASINRRFLSLPSGSNLSRKQLERICVVIRQHLPVATP